MIRIILLLSFVLTTLSIVAEDNILVTRQAEAFFEAQDYDKALELFKKLQGESLHHWQAERLHYNIGTIDLEEGNWEAASEEYSAIEELPGRAHYIAGPLKTNQSLLLFRQALELLKQPHLKLEDYGKAIFLLRSCIQKIEDAQVADCRFAKFIGQNACDPEQDLVQLKSAAKRELAFTLKKYGDAKINESSLKEGVPFLLSGVKENLTHLVFLESKGLDENLKKKYVEMFANDAASWLSLWDAQLSLSKDLNGAHKYYLEGLQMLQNENLPKSRLAFLSSKKALSVLIKKLWGNDQLINLLQSLLVGYDRALEQVPIQASTLSRIETEQAQMENLANENTTIEELFHTSNLSLSKSIVFAKHSKQQLAHFFLYEARQWIRRIVYVKAGKNQDPQSILEDAIDNQSHALTLQRIRHDMKKDYQQLNEFLVNSQKQTLQASNPFLSAVIDEEIKKYRIACQCKPWDEVIPLFEKGQQAADASMALINQGHHRILVMKQQEKAVKFWKDALEKLKKKDQNKAPPPPSKQKKESTSQQPEPTASINDVLRDLQQMDQDDRSPKFFTTPPKKGLKPW